MRGAGVVSERAGAALGAWQTSPPVALLLAAVVLAYEPLAWLINTWRDPVYDSNPEPQIARDADVNQPMVKGVAPGAYPNGGQLKGRQPGQHPRPMLPPRSASPQQRASNPFYQTVAALPVHLRWHVDAPSLKLLVVWA
jgi:hypothetical protein